MYWNNCTFYQMSATWLRSGATNTIVAGGDKDVIVKQHI